LLPLDRCTYAPSSTHLNGKLITKVGLARRRPTVFTGPPPPDAQHQHAIDDASQHGLLLRGTNRAKWLTLPGRRVPHPRSDHLMVALDAERDAQIDPARSEELLARLNDAVAVAERMREQSAS
jgi:hypothetical protein